MGKKIAGVALILVLAITGIAYYLFTNLDPMVKRAIEKYGSQIAGVPVTVGEVAISLSSGQGTIRNLVIANPPGFEGDATFELGEVNVGIDLASLGKQPTVISQVLIEAPRVNVIANGKGQTNIDTIRKNIDSHSVDEPDKGAGTASRSSDEAEPLLRIGKFTFSDAALSADLTAAGGEKYETTLPALHLDNLGGKSGGTPEQIGQEMMKGVTDVIAREVASAGVNSLIDRHLEGGAADAAKGAVREFMKLKGD